MQMNLPLVFGLLACANPPPAGAPAFEVKGAATQTSSYCGGMAPSPEKVAALSKPVPAATRTFDVYFGDEATGSAISHFTTGSDGRYRLELAKGTWCAVDTTRRIPPGSTPIAGADASCWTRESKRCDLKFVVTTTAQDVGTANFVNRCGWQNACGPYVPPPP